MIERTSGDLLQSPAEALVNAVNCVGIMGKGLALQFRNRFPKMFADYAEACDGERIVIGRMHTFDRGHDFNQGRWIINFPTKRHWREPSRLEFIESGLRDLVVTVERLEIRSLAVPALGCGLGGLRWEEVEPRIESAFAALANVQVLLYPPQVPKSPKY